ncbi:Serine/threonine-protein kinase Pkn1 [Novipirellula aureliae]|uniref:Serine/threonine-protein kinase Pkn1 n=1 Tax=Novipirellula aureliae TaxID=2527966 RepID=A0A5C6E5T9_9BACT|nr:serine/threonine-protein kinase [Novipirellula aureliae]TWU44188.1 Serine/threonine-protein kinase Pkn1 [Novipirellula aureliae]
MSPEQYAAAKIVFLKAMGLPADQRDAMCKVEAGSDPDVLNEVRTLLKHHNDASLLKTMVPTSVPTPLVDTDELPRTMDSVEPPGSPISRQSGGVSRIDVVDDRSASDLETRMNASTRQFLRQRMMIAVTVLTLVLIAIRFGALILGDPARDNAVRFGLVFILVSVLLFLKFKQNVSLRTLRILVAIVIAMPMLEVIEIQIQECEDLALAGRLVEIPVLMLSIHLVTALLISLYSTFLPSTWKRTAIVTTLMALTPSLVAWIQGSVSESLVDARMVPFAGPLLTTLTAAVATAGAHFVHRMRLEAEDARSYGQYRLLEEIGRGGMGVVYRAEHRMLKRPAAIKLIHSESAAQENEIKQFEQEVQISATLTHWNTVQIYDYGTTEAGDFFYVMEYLEGETLAERLRRERIRRERPLNESEMKAIALQLCDGLAEAHAKGMIHRDLKPANIFLANIGGQSNVVKIVDFGLAVVVSDDMRVRAAGTPGYMSPEQITGGTLDGRSDIYAIGCVMYECLTGQSVFPSSRLHEVLQSHLFKIPDFNDLDSIAPAFRPVVQKCLAKQPDDRFDNVSELRRCLADA